MRTGFLYTASLAAGLALGCGDDGAPGDAGTDAPTVRDGGVDAQLPRPAAPVEAALPVLTPCPGGWAEVPIDGVTTCEPWSSGTPRCAGGDVRFPGDAACHAVGDPCPADGWPAGLPKAARVLHVMPGATAGDGSRAAPFGTVAEATAIAAASDVIALARGEHPEAILVPAGVTIWGACASETIVAAPEGGPTTGSVVLEPDATLRSITVRGDRPGVRMDLAGTANVRDVALTGRGFGLLSLRGTVVAESVRIADITPDGSERGFGVYADFGARIELHRAVVHGTTAAALGATRRSAITIEDTVVSDTSVSDGLGACAVLSDGDLIARRSVLERCHTAGALVVDGSSVDMESSLVRDVSPVGEAMAIDGYGIALITNASLRLVRSRVSRATSVGVASADVGSMARLEDVVIDGTLPFSIEHTSGSGADAEQGGTLSVARGLFVDNHTAGLACTGTGAVIDAEDVTVLRTRQTESVLRAGLGLAAIGRCTLRARRARIERSISAGVQAEGYGTTMELADLVVRDTMANDLGAAGRGINVQVGPIVSIERALVERSVEAGILVQSEGSTATLRDITIASTIASEISGAAMGLAVVAGGAADLERFAVTDHGVSGMQIATAGSLRARVGVVARNPVGINIQDGAVTPEDVTDRVFFLENGMNLDSSSLPVPSSVPTP